MHRAVLIPIAMLAVIALLPSAGAAQPAVQAVHFDHPVTEADRAALKAAGAEILEASPPNGYWVRFPTEARAAQLPPGTRLEPRTAQDKLTAELHDVVHSVVHPGGPLTLRAVTYRGTSALGPAVAVRPFVPVHGQLQAVDDASGRGTIWARVGENDVAAAALALASHPDVAWVERYNLPVPLNDNSSWLIQSADQTMGRTVFLKGINGWGQVIGVADTGIDADACQFRYSADRSSVTTAITFPQPPAAVIEAPGNKVITYYVLASSEPYDDSNGGYHGSHTVGDAAGDNYAHPATATAAGHDPQDGMAPGAQVVLQDIGNNSGYLVGLNGISMYDLLRQSYDTGARIHNNSYGFEGLMVGYDPDSSSIDAATWELNDLVVVFAAGNSGADTNGNPQQKSLGGTGSTAKNTLVVGASGPVELNIYGTTYHLQNDLMYFSSEGPTADSRIKPDVVAPGLVFSANTNESTQIDLGCCEIGSTTRHKFTSSNDDNNCNVDTGWPSMGTSFASPITAGAAALVRQYFTDGFWLAGKSAPGSGFNPTNALVKAAIINGASPLTGSIIGMGTNFTLTKPPSVEQGWGRVKLEDSLWFEGDDRITLVLNDTPNPVPTNPMATAALAPFPYGQPPLVTGDQKTWLLPIPVPQRILKITLAWSDPPALAGAERTLINDLDLEVTAPNGDFYFGNREFDNDGFSQPSMIPKADVVNNVENVILKEPQIGPYQVTVKATAVNGNGQAGSTAQGYALLVTGEFERPTPTAIKPDQGAPGDTLKNVRVTGKNFVDGLTLSFGDGLTASGVKVVDDKTATIETLVIDKKAKSGKRDVTATLYYNLSGVGSGLFSVNPRGCGCGSDPAGMSLFLGLLGFVLVFGRMRRE